MFSGNGHEYITFGWIATIILALIAGSIYHSQYTRIQQSSEYADKCAAQYHDRLSGLNTSPSEKKTSDSNQKHEGQPDWCDLAAQHSMAESTRGLHWAAWATVSFTGLGAYLIWQTLLATQKTAEAAKETITVTREMGQAQTRAYLSCIGARYWLADRRLFVECTVKNYGQSPAMNVVSKLNFDYDAFDNPQSPDSAVSKKSRYAIGGDYLIPSGVEVPIRYFITNVSVGSDNPNAIKEIIDESRLRFFTAEMFWIDVFDKKDELHFNLFDDEDDLDLPDDGDDIDLRIRHKPPQNRGQKS